MKKTLRGLKAQQKKLVKEAEAFRATDGSFKDDPARASFDAKMVEADAVSVQIRALEGDEDEDEDPPVDAIAGERQRCIDIRQAFRVAKIDKADELADQHIAAATTMDRVRSIVLEQLAAKDAATATDATQGILPGEDARDKWVRGATNWLLTRSGMVPMVAKHTGEKVSEFEPGEFRGMSLLDMGREVLVRAKQQVRGVDRMELAGMALGFRSSYQTGSDFATVLENAMHKVLRAAYGITPDTWSLFCGTASVSDFRTNNWYRMGSLTEFDSLNEHGEFKNKNIPDAEKATFSIATKGNIIGITREVIVNDDLGFVMRLIEMMGRAGKLTIEKAVYAKLALNSNLGPTMSDTKALFHTDHSNINATASAITMAGIEADRVVMASQKDVNGIDFLDLRPKVLLVPIGKGGDAKTINDAMYDPADNKFQKPNIVRGLFSTIVDSPRISGTRRYMFADPTIAPVLLVSFLEGMREPVLETKDGWRTSGVELRGRLDFGVDAVDTRGAVTNAGA